MPEEHKHGCKQVLGTAVGDDHQSPMSRPSDGASDHQNERPRCCDHPDIREFGGTSCCLSCGSAGPLFFEEPDTFASESSSDEEKEPEIGNPDGIGWDFQAEESAAAVFRPHGFNQKFTRQKGSYGFAALQMDKKEIRLVELKPGKSEEPVACNIFHAVLGSWNQPSYEAVSYTWADENGDYSFSRTLRCGKKDVPITSNCEAALQRVRLKPQSRRVWIDQICIDQSDLEERGHQVGLMSDIYAGADQVLVFLGLNTCFADEVFTCAAQLRPWPPYGFHFREKLISSKVHRVLSSSWFTRVWVLQEIACAKRAVLMSSSSSVQWSLFQTFITDWANKTVNAKSTDSSLESRKDALLGRLPGPLNFNLRHLATPDQLLDLLLSTNSCNAGDPRDKVFALYGIIIGAAQQGLNANYNKSPQQAFVEIARHIIQREGNLRILSCAQSGEPPSLSLPSWVPDWGTRRGRSLKDFLIAQAPKFVRGHYFAPLHLLGSRVHSSDLSCAMDLTAFGRCLEPVTQVTRLRSSLELEAAREYKEAVRKFRESFWHKASGTCSPSYSGHSLPQAITEAFLVPQNMSFCSKCFQEVTDMMEWAASRHLYWFATKSSFGCLFNEARSGDQIWQLDGADVLFVCRPSQDGLVLIGDCILWGFSFHICCWSAYCSGDDVVGCIRCSGFRHIPPREVVIC